MAEVQNQRDFFSNDTGVDRSEYAVTVGFARNLSDEDSDDAFLVQRSLDPNEDKPGIAGVYVEIPPQRYAMYGGIEGATLHRDRFELRLTPSGAKSMGGHRKFLARFKLDAKQFKGLRDSLRFVFGGCNSYQEVP